MGKSIGFDLGRPIGTIAACAMEGLGLFTEWPEDRPSKGDRPSVSSEDRSSAASTVELRLRVQPRP